MYTKSLHIAAIIVNNLAQEVSDIRGIRIQICGKHDFRVLKTTYLLESTERGTKTSYYSILRDDVNGSAYADLRRGWILTILPLAMPIYLLVFEQIEK